MREAHAHIFAHGESLRIPRLDDCTSLGECLDRLRRACASAPPNHLVRLANARIEAWVERRWPTLKELDLAARGHPCVIMSFDYHNAVANSAAIAKAGLRAGQAVEPGGRVVVDPATGNPSGLLLEGAAYAVWKCAPEPAPDQRTEILRAALGHLASLGFTEVHDLHSQPWLGPELAKLERAGELNLNIRLYPPVARLVDDHAQRARWESPRLRLAGGKLFADGTLNARTALVLHPYRNPAPATDPRGQAMHTRAEIEAAVRTCESLNLHLATHAIGDAAVRLTLDAIASATKRLTASITPDTAHRIEHAELIDATDVPRFAAQRIVCSVQPCHLLTDIEVLTRQLPHRLHRVLPLRELIDAGCTPGQWLWFGSDAPIVRPDPGDSIQAAVHRRRTRMSESEAVAFEQCITEAEARACFRAGMA